MEAPSEAPLFPVAWRPPARARAGPRRPRARAACRRGVSSGRAPVRAFFSKFRHAVRSAGACPRSLNPVSRKSPRGREVSRPSASVNPADTAPESTPDAGAGRVAGEGRGRSSCGWSFVFVFPQGWPRDRERAGVAQELEVHHTISFAWACPPSARWATRLAARGHTPEPEVATRFGARGQGTRGWLRDWYAAKQVIDRYVCNLKPYKLSYFTSTPRDPGGGECAASPTRAPPLVAVPLPAPPLCSHWCSYARRPWT